MNPVRDNQHNHSAVYSFAKNKLMFYLNDKTDLQPSKDGLSLTG